MQACMPLSPAPANTSCHVGHLLAQESFYAMHTYGISFGGVVENYFQVKTIKE